MILIVYLKGMFMTEYLTLLQEVKESIRKAQIKANLAVNAEMLFMYWDVGLPNSLCEIVSSFPHAVAAEYTIKNPESK